MTEEAKAMEACAGLGSCKKCKDCRGRAVGRVDPDRQARCTTREMDDA
jgi:hypothetical protein